MRRLYFLLPILLFAAVIAAFVVGLGRDPSKLPSTMIDKPLPVFDLPPVRAGDSGLKSADIQGEPRLLNVFASWCVSCRVEHPLLLALKARGVPIDGLDWMDKADAASAYLVANGDPYARVGNDQPGRAGIDLGVAGVPETFIVDRRGKVRYKQIGPITEDDWKGTISPLLERLRAES